MISRGFSLFGWVVLGAAITGLGSAATALPVFTEFPVDGAPEGITAGPDGNLWFTEVSGGRIGRITPAGEITEFPVTSGVGLSSITAGPEGNLWFSEGGPVANGIGRITPAGVIAEFPILTHFPQGTPGDIKTGPDGNLWFMVLGGANKIGRITPEGVVTEFPLPFQPLTVFTLAFGPDGDMWIGKFRGIVRVGLRFLALSPGSGVYVTTQRFDLTLLGSTFGSPIVDIQATFDGTDVTAALTSCGILGTILSWGVTFRCPVVEKLLLPGSHTFSIVLKLGDGSSLSDSATWEFLANTEP